MECQVRSKGELPGRHGVAVELIDAHDSGVYEPTKVQHNTNPRGVGMPGPYRWGMSAKHDRGDWVPW